MVKDRKGKEKKSFLFTLITLWFLFHCYDYVFPWDYCNHEVLLLTYNTTLIRNHYNKERSNKKMAAVLLSSVYILLVYFATKGKSPVTA